MSRVLLYCGIGPSKFGMSAYLIAAFATLQSTSGGKPSVLATDVKKAAWSAVRAGTPPYSGSSDADWSWSRNTIAAKAASWFLLFLRTPNVSALSGAVVLPLYAG